MTYIPPLPPLFTHIPPSIPGVPPDPGVTSSEPEVPQTRGVIQPQVLGGSGVSQSQSLPLPISIPVVNVPPPTTATKLAMQATAKLNFVGFASWQDAYNDALMKAGYPIDNSVYP